ncbi:DUF4079 domain-containing protein [Limnofasciculus baicalensis]|uniref:DUF4079 domain-containing protein n=1 Tax=Limnofasciculus baicalensis BBK-W-15 TaxID=2699891 RepID=A0AAE3GWX8_9CYAN|nr:DUF4079 domain-containing protein [Limnofasciculus baicalensis]MCP2730102.1 DUF4079 domain-containing protein [Limnofasciculus baicalensis BBK-W-15]
MNLESIKVYAQFIHPLVMWGLLALTIYALYLGIKIQKTRTAQGDEKKELIKGQYNVKHHQVGSALLSFMVIAAIGAMGVSYINNGKLFVDAHLIVGLGMTGLIATSASLTPFMQKGKTWARYTHIALNVTLLGLFGWQAITGIQIIQNILGKLNTTAS